VFLSFAGVARGSTLDDYDARLSRVLAAMQSTSSGHSGAERTGPSNLDFVSESLPAKELIRFRGQTIAVDNSWLESEINDYNKSTKAADRSAAVARITERLKAIQEHVQELERAATQPGDKDADRPTGEDPAASEYIPRRRK
jgi:hypothetical protein